MKKIALISDTHGDLSPLIEMVEREPKVAAFFHAGDGYKELEALQKLYPKRKILGVTGNCDYATRGKDSLLVDFEGASILITHGHLYGVKSSLTKLGEEGLAIGADLVLYGHTHKGKVTKIKGTHLINGGYGSPKLGGKASYCTIEIIEGQVVVEYKALGDDL